MNDALQYYLGSSRQRSQVLTNLGLERNGYILTTLHRPANTDDANRLCLLLSTFRKIRGNSSIPYSSADT